MKTIQIFDEDYERIFNHSADGTIESYDNKNRRKIKFSIAFNIQNMLDELEALREEKQNEKGELK